MLKISLNVKKKKNRNVSLGLQLALQVSFPKGASLPSSLPDGEKTQEELGWFPELLGNQSARNPGPDPGPQDSG